MKITGADSIIKFLEAYGITTIPGIPGGANLPLYNALYKSTRIRHILVRHEQGGGFIAQGMARASGKPAVCFATSGPGATNLVTAIADAYLDSIPVIAITGQVSSSLIGTDAFQEVDFYGMTIPITKHTFLVRTAEELLTVLPEAFRIATTGRPGPVVVDVPKDVQMQMTNFDACVEIGTCRQPTQSALLDDERIAEAARMINTAERPVICVGGGVIHGAAHEIVAAIARKNHIPVAATLMGLGAFPADDPLALGMIGMHGSRMSNHMIAEADVFIACGMRFGDRTTGKIAQFCPQAKIVHIDIDGAEINKIKGAHVSIVADIGAALIALEPDIEPNERRPWMERLSAVNAQYPARFAADDSSAHPTRVMRAVGEIVPHDTIIATDVGQHQMWVAQSYPFRQPRTLLTSGGLGTMGFGLPAAIGAALAQPERKVVCFSGDGSIMMNLQELATLAELNCDVTVILMNNGYLGLVRQQQELFYQSQHIAVKFDLRPDFVAIARGFNIRAYDLAGSNDWWQTLQEALGKRGPCFITVPIDHRNNVLPMVPPGAANHEMIG